MKSAKTKLEKELKRALQLPVMGQLPYRSKLGRARIRKAVQAVVQARTAKSGGGKGQ